MTRHARIGAVAIIAFLAACGADEADTDTASSSADAATPARTYTIDFDAPCSLLPRDAVEAQFEGAELNRIEQINAAEASGLNYSECTYETQGVAPPNAVSVSMGLTDWRSSRDAKGYFDFTMGLESGLSEPVEGVGDVAAFESENEIGGMILAGQFIISIEARRPGEGLLRDETVALTREVGKALE